MKRKGDNLNSRVKDFFEDKKLTKYSIFIVCTFTILFAIWAIIRNIGTVVPTVTGALGWFIGLFASFLIGMVIAYILNPLVNFISRKTHLDDRSFGRPVSVLITFVVILAALFLLLYGFTALILGKVVIGSLPDLYNTLYDTFRSYEASIRNWASHLPNGTFSDGMQGLIDKVLKWITTNFSASSIINTVIGAAGSVINLVIGIMFSVYMLLYTDSLVAFWNMLLDLFIPSRKETLNGTLHEIDGVVSKFIKGIAIDATIIAILSATGLTLVHIKFAVFLGLFAGVCNVIPYFGPFIGMIPAFLVGTLTSDLLHGAMAVVVMFIIQQFDSNLIYPKVVGKQTGLHPLYVLLAVTIGGGVGGLLGMVLAVPIAGVIKLFFDKYVDKKQAARSKETENSEQTTSAESSEDSASTV